MTPNPAANATIFDITYCTPTISYNSINDEKSAIAAASDTQKYPTICTTVFAKENFAVLPVNAPEQTDIPFRRTEKLLKDSPIFINYNKIM